jgi:hypothetical protein
MDLLRHLTLLTLKYNIYVRVNHIEGKRNEIADSLSRFQLEKFHTLAPYADPTHSSCPPGDLNADIEYYLALSITASTQQTYNSGEKQFINFCYLYRPIQSQMMPADENTLIQFVAYLAKSIKHSSIKGYLAAVRHLHIRNGFELDLKKYVRLQLVYGA